jgi:hypothetical protein
LFVCLCCVACLFVFAFACFLFVCVYYGKRSSSVLSIAVRLPAGPRISYRSQGLRAFTARSSRAITARKYWFPCVLQHVSYHFASVSWVLVVTRMPDASLVLVTIIVVILRTRLARARALVRNQCLRAFTARSNRAITSLRLVVIQRVTANHCVLQCLWALLRFLCVFGIGLSRYENGLLQDPCGGDVLPWFIFFIILRAFAFKS